MLDEAASFSFYSSDVYIHDFPRFFFSMLSIWGEGWRVVVVVVVVVAIVVFISYGPSMKWKWGFVNIGAILGKIGYGVWSMA